jgi:hypothetical protein
MYVPFPLFSRIRIFGARFFSFRVGRVFFFCFFILLVIPNWVSFPFRDFFSQFVSLYPRLLVSDMFVSDQIRSMKIQTELFLVAIAPVYRPSLTFLIVSSYSNRGGMAMRVVRDTRGPSSEKVGRSHCGHTLHWWRSRLPFHPQSKYSPQNNTH